MVYDKIANSKIFNTLPSNQLNKTIYDLQNENEKQLNVINNFLDDLLRKIEVRKSDLAHLRTINKLLYSATVYLYQNSIFDFTISVYSLKLDAIQNENYLIDKVENREEEFKLKGQFYTPVLNKTLDEGTSLKKLLFSNSSNINSNSNKSFNIHVGSNSLTIF